MRAPAADARQGQRIHHDGTGVFRGLPAPFKATRYHSLIVDRASCPTTRGHRLDRGRADHGRAHRDLPIHGVQFHPESIASNTARRCCAIFSTSRSAGGVSRVSAPSCDRPVRQGEGASLTKKRRRPPSTGYVGRSDAGADRRLPDGAAAARRDGRGDHRRGPLMRARCPPIEAPPGAVDTCGTGGDGTGTFNISTAAALRRRRLRRAGRQARQPRPVVALRLRRRSGRSRRRYRRAVELRGAACGDWDRLS